MGAIMREFWFCGKCDKKFLTEADAEACEVTHPDYDSFGKEVVRIMLHVETFLREPLADRDVMACRQIRDAAAKHGIALAEKP